MKNMENMENMENICEKETQNSQDVSKYATEIIEIMTHIMNYLSVSLYENQFTKNHEDSYATLHSIYDRVASTPSKPPSLLDCESFYSNITYLANVTYTDDPDYYTFKRSLRKYIITLKT